MLEQTTGLQIRVLGPMEVRVGGGPLPHLRSRKGLWLLALLTLRAGREVDREWIAGTLWPDSDQTAARRSLRQSLHDLRSALGAQAWRIVTETPRTLRLNVMDADLDLLEFDAAMTRADPAALAAAVKLYRGPLLEEWTEEWTLEERRYREQSYMTALQTLATGATHRSDHAAAVGYLRLAAGADPYREDLQRALIEALGSNGDSAAALLTYREFRARLWREMTLLPEEATTELFRKIRDARRRQARGHRPTEHAAETASASASTVAAPRRDLPFPLTDLIGRDEAVQEILGQLRGARLVTLTGTGGIGKTRLALQVASELEGEYEDGTWFVNLAPIADPGLIPNAIREALGITAEKAGQEAMLALKQHLARRHLLLVLDNCEHLVSACVELAEGLLTQCASLQILATSRHALGMRGERLWRVPPLALPPASGDKSVTGADLQALPPANFAAVRLFVERARAAESSFRVTPHNGAAIVQVCRRLDGIPLAIELAAARVRSLSVEEIGSRLRKNFRLVAGGPVAVLPRHQTLAATFAWSWDLLLPAEQIVLRRLAVFVGGWSLEAVEAICGGEGVEPGDVVDLLTSLVDKSLVVYRPANIGDCSPGSKTPVARYHLLETVRQFASEKLSASQECDGVQNRHRDYFLEWAEAIRPSLWGSEQAHWFGRLEVEHDNLRAVLHWSRSHSSDAEQELRLVVAVSRFWDTCGYVQEGRAHLDAAIGRMAPEFPHKLRVEALKHAGWMAYLQGDGAAGRAYLGPALTIARELNDAKITSAVLNDLGTAAKAEGDFTTARTCYEEALALRREIGLTANLGAILNNLGTLALYQEDYEAGRAYLEESASWCEGIEGQQQQHGITLLNLSGADYRQGRYVEAQAHCTASLRLLRDCGAVVNIHSALDRLALLAHVEGQWERAARLLGAAAGVRARGGGLRIVRAAECEEATAAAKRAIGIDRFEAAYAEGMRMNQEQFMEYALGV